MSRTLVPDRPAPAAPAPRRHRPGRTPSAVGLALALVAGCGACASAAASSEVASASAQAGAELDGAAGPTPKIQWGRCATPKGITPNARQVCGTLKVPLDYRNPGGRTITVAVSKIPATTSRRGVMLFNPGGPGGSGLFLPNHPLLPAAVTARYDQIGFDPRGVGRSTPISCGLTEKELEDSRWNPETKDQIQRSASFLHSYARRCADKSGDLLPHITTANTARDMDRIRKALGEEKISYFGASYGTYLGAVYSSMFNQHTDRFVLDSAVGPHMVWADMFAAQDAGFQRRLEQVFAQIATGTKTTPAAVARTYLSVTARLDAAPITLPGVGYPITTVVARGKVSKLVYAHDPGPTVSALFDSLAAIQARHGTAKDRAFLASLFAEDVTPGVPVDNGLAVQKAVTCGEGTWPKDVTFYEQTVAKDLARYPLSFVPGTGDLAACIYWKARAVEPLVPITDRGQRNILVLQNRLDPATVWEAGLDMRRTLGQRAGFVGVDDGGHVVTGTHPCADKVTTTFFLTGALPSQDVACPA